MILSNRNLTSPRAHRLGVAFLGLGLVALGACAAPGPSLEPGEETYAEVLFALHRGAEALAPGSVVVERDGRTESVDSLEGALGGAQDGDRILLSRGRFVVHRLDFPARSLTIIGQGPGTVILDESRADSSFQTNALSTSIRMQSTAGLPGARVSLHSLSMFLPHFRQSAEAFRFWLVDCDVFGSPGGYSMSSGVTLIGGSLFASSLLGAYGDPSFRSAGTLIYAPTGEEKGGVQRFYQQRDRKLVALEPGDWDLPDEATRFFPAAQKGSLAPRLSAEDWGALDVGLPAGPADLYANYAEALLLASTGAAELPSLGWGLDGDWERLATEQRRAVAQLEQAAAEEAARVREEAARVREEELFNASIAEEREEWNALLYAEPEPEAEAHPAETGGLELSSEADLAQAQAEISQLLFYVLTEGSLADLETWATHGPDLEERNDKGATVLIVASDLGDVNRLRILMEHGANLEAQTPTGFRPLHAAVSNNQVDAVKFLLARGADPESRIGLGYTPLMIAATSGFDAVAQALVAHGVLLDEVSKEGNAALHLALETGQTALLKTLIDAGSQLEIKDSNGLTPLALASYTNKMNMVAVLINAGAKLGARSKLGLTAVQLALQGAAFESLAVLIQAGADLEQPSADGLTPLQLAVVLDSARGTLMLLNAGADRTVRMPDGASLLHLAAIQDQAAMARQLLEAGVDPSWVTEAGQTALDMAVELNSHDVIQVLQRD